MLKKILTCAIALITVLVSIPLYAVVKDDTSSFNPEQQKAIQKIIHDYLVNQPEVLIEASQALQEKQMQQAKTQALRGITQNKDKLFNDPNSPIGGNPNGTINLVEFFDYNCGHCKTSQPILEKLLNANKDVKIIYKEFPIFGASSDFAAKAALAAAKQNKYAEFHSALFKVNGALNENKILEIAKDNHINVDQLKKDMNSESIKQELSNNFNLAKALELEGTPSFVLSSRSLTQFDFIPGAVSEQSLQQAINKIKQKKDAN